MRLWITAILSGALCCSVALADTAAEMLEKGIYNQDTIGNFEEAIKIYREVLEVADETDRLAAQAQFRLAQCLLKQGKQSEAVAAFEKVVAKFASQKDLVAQAKRHLPNKLELLPAPWKSGEQCTLMMRLAGGRTVGLVGTSVDAAKEDGKAVWRMSVRRFIASGQNEGVSHVILDQATNRPIQTDWAHTVLGSASAVWKNESVVISTKNEQGKSEEKKVDFEGIAYCNDQWLFGLRQLPLKVGYKVTIPIRIAFTGGNPLGFEITVSKKEKIKTALGELDCFRLDTNIGQTLWITDTPDRYLARFEAEGVTATLTSVKQAETRETIDNKALGFTIDVPPGWFHFDRGSDNEDKSTRIALVGPKLTSAMVHVRDKQLLDSDQQQSLTAWEAGKLAGGRRAVKDIALREPEAKETELAGVAARQFSIDQTINKQPWIRTAIIALTETRALEMGITVPQHEEHVNASLIERLRKTLKVD